AGLNLRREQRPPDRGPTAASAEDGETGRGEGSLGKKFGQALDLPQFRCRHWERTMNLVDSWRLHRGSLLSRAQAYPAAYSPPADRGESHCRDRAHCDRLPVAGDCAPLSALPARVVTDAQQIPATHCRSPLARSSCNALHSRSSVTMFQPPV